jgi:hypothetical protein
MPPPWNLPDSPNQGTKLDREMAMSDLDDFLTPTLARQLEAEQALINGDPAPRLAMWSTQEPVTVFGAEKSVIGSEEVRQVFHWLASRFSNCTDYRFELVAAGASGDLAYTLGYEHFSFSMGRRPGRADYPTRHPRLPPRGRRNGKSASAATSPKAPWPSSSRRSRRCRQPSSYRHRLPSLTPHGGSTYTTPRDAAASGRRHQPGGTDDHVI